MSSDLPISDFSLQISIEARLNFEKIDMANQHNTIIESIGIYLPPKSVSTAELMHGCKNKIRFPLEKITGIKTRRMAGKTEFAIDLAKHAVANCLAKSKYTPVDIDLLFCCNISRYDGPNFRFSFEPNTAVKLKKHFGFTHALTFDITNACAGMFTGIYLVDTFIKAGAIRCGMVVSGEYITHLTETAQKEIESFLDARLACLTVGDAGAAIILEESPNDNVGFHALDLRTLGRYSKYCIGKTSEQAHGGMIMYTDSLHLTEVAVKYGAQHALHVLAQAEWPPESFHHLIMHQTSNMTLNSARREINHLLKKNVCHEGNTVDNLAERGNTASTTHFVAVIDNILNNKINSGDKVIFGITASGLTIGTALYTFDDLPDRFRQTEETSSPLQKLAAGEKLRAAPLLHGPRLRIESWGTISPDSIGKTNSMEFLKLAATNCLGRSSYQRHDLELLIYSGVYRSEYIMEPAIAALLAGELDMNAATISPEGKKTFAFDIFNGALGVLNACYVIQQMLRAKKCRRAMIVAAEVENNEEVFPEQLLGICEASSALILDEDSSGQSGFSRFLFRSFTGQLDAYTSYLTNKNGKAYLHIDKSIKLEEYYLASVLPTVRELLLLEGLELSQITRIFPPQISSTFIAKLSEAMNFSKEKFVNVVGEGKDLFTSSLPYALQFAHAQNLIKAGDIGLMISVGSGLQVGCAVYYF